MADAFFVHEGKEYRVTKMAARTITRRGNDTRTVGAVWDLTVFPSEPGDTLNIDSLTMIEYGFRFPGSTIVHPYSGFVVSAYREFDSADLLIAVLYDGLQLEVKQAPHTQDERLAELAATL